MTRDFVIDQRAAGELLSTLLVGGWTGPKEDRHRWSHHGNLDPVGSGRRTTLGGCEDTKSMSAHDRGTSLGPAITATSRRARLENALQHTGQQPAPTSRPVIDTAVNFRPSTRVGRYDYFGMDSSVGGGSAEFFLEMMENGGVDRAGHHREPGYRRGRWASENLPPSSFDLRQAQAARSVGLSVVGLRAGDVQAAGVAARTRHLEPAGVRGRNAPAGRASRPSFRHCGEARLGSRSGGGPCIGQGVSGTTRPVGPPGGARRL